MTWQRLSGFPDLKMVDNYDIELWAIRDGYVWHQGRKLSAADSSTFEVMQGHPFIARDARGVYHAWSRMRTIDRDSFCNVGDYWRDNTAVYFEHETSLKSLKEVDVKTFRSIGGGYGADNHSGWYCGRRMKCCAQGDKLRLQREDPLYAHDDEHVYCDGKPLPGVDPRQWRLLGSSFSRDDKRIYYMERRLPRVDIDSWQHLEGSWSKDRNNIFHMNFIEKGPAKLPSLKSRNEHPSK